ncbi:MAG: hypothetical protein ACRCV0_00390 [Brevinema sp.]
MAIIDDIYYIESTISEIKNNATSQITHLQEKEQEKEIQLREQFSQEFEEFKKENEANLHSRINVFHNELFSSIDSLSDSLYQKFESTKQAIIKKTIDEFWQE